MALHDQSRHVQILEPHMPFRRFHDGLPGNQLLAIAQAGHDRFEQNLAVGAFFQNADARLEFVMRMCMTHETEGLLVVARSSARKNIAQQRLK